MSVPPATPDGSLVSVVMTTWNGAPFVRAAVGSLLAQSHRALDVVVVDDGSTDGTPAILRELARADGRLRVVPAVHRGIAASRNHGLALAAGPFVTFLDQDDLCPPGRIARQADRLAREPGVAALFGRTSMFGPQAAASPEHDAPPPVLTMLMSAALFRREAVDAVGPFDPGYAIADDFDFVLRLLESGRAVAVEDDVGVLYRRHAGQRTADRAATRREAVRALSASVRRRRACGLGELRHPLAGAAWPTLETVR